MGNKSKFTFPLPGWRTKQPTEPTATAVPLTKAQKILGTSGINTGNGSARQPWDSRSGISVSISESSASHTTADTGLDIVDEEDDGTTGTSYGARGWDAESDILPRHLPSGHGLRMQRSAVTLGNDYRTDASSIQRRQSNASTIYSHYDRSKVPLAISQQTSSSAMAKGLPNKANSLLDMDGSLSAPAGRKKKPSRLDISMLKPRSRREKKPTAASVLGNDYVNLSPSFIYSPHEMPNKLRKTPSGTSMGTYNGPISVQDTATLSQLYDHYEQMTFRADELLPGDSPTDSRFGSTADESTPPLTTSSTISSNAPSSNPVIHEPSRHLGHSRNDSAGSRHTITSSISPSVAHSQQRAPGRDCASSISSRNTRTSKTSKTSRTLESDLQTNSVLSLSDSDSDDGAFSDSAPKSSASSHTNISHDDIVSFGVAQKSTPTRSPVMPERSSSRQKHNSFAPLNDYLAVPGSGGKGFNSRHVSTSTLRSTSSSTSTARATDDYHGGSERGSRLSVSTTDTSDSLRSAMSRKTKHNQTGAQEARAVTLMPLASTAEALDSLRELTARATSDQHNPSSSDQPTPPLSPASFSSHKDSVSTKDEVHDDSVDAHNARLMAVTKQEEMLLAALRHKRALMRENIIAEIEGDKGSSNGNRSRRTSNASSRRRDSQLSSNSAHSNPSNRIPSGPPQLPPFQPRNSSLVSSFKSLTERKDTVRRSDNIVRFADDTQDFTRSDPIEKRSSSAMSNATIKPSTSGRHERVLMYLDRPIYDIDAVDAAEPSPDLSEFMDYDLDSDGEISPERRRSRRTSKYNSTYSIASPTGKRFGERPDSNLLGFGTRSSSLRQPLENLPESNMEGYDDEDDMDFDGFSDVMNPPRSELAASDRYRGHDIARPDSPVQTTAKSHVKGHVKGKNSAVRLSAVGNIGSFLPPEAGLWGDDG